MPATSSRQKRQEAGQAPETRKKPGSKASTPSPLPAPSRTTTSRTQPRQSKAKASPTHAPVLPPPTAATGPAPKRRGRPPVGEATRIRLPPDLEQFATEISGSETMAVGVRMCIQFTRDHIEGATPSHEMLLVPKELAAAIRAIGSGSMTAGLELLANAAVVLTPEAIRRLSKG